MKDKILVVQEDPKISRMLEIELKFEAFEVHLAQDGKEGMDMFKYGSYDLIILDITLAKVNGIEFCRKIREVSNIPVIMLSAKTDIEDKIAAFEAGADDYITKPFINEELILRMRAILRRTKKNQDAKGIFEYEDLRINYPTYEVFRKNELIKLSKREFELLDFLVLNKGIVLTRDKILEEVWGFDQIGNDNILDLYIKYLRDKIDKPYDRKLIQTVRGIGFIFK